VTSIRCLDSCCGPVPRGGCSSRLPERSSPRLRPFWIAPVTLSALETTPHQQVPGQKPLPASSVKSLQAFNRATLFHPSSCWPKNPDRRSQHIVSAESITYASYSTPPLYTVDRSESAVVLIRIWLCSAFRVRQPNRPVSGIPASPAANRRILASSLLSLMLKSERISRPVPHYFGGECPKVESRSAWRNGFGVCFRPFHVWMAYHLGNLWRRLFGSMVRRIAALAVPTG
jgi:hypothetical protein